MPITTMAIMCIMDMIDTKDTVRIIFYKCNFFILISQLKSSNFPGYPNSVDRFTSKPSLLDFVRNALSNMYLFASNSVSYLSSGVSRVSRQLTVVSILLV